MDRMTEEPCFRLHEILLVSRPSPPAGGSCDDSDRRRNGHGGTKGMGLLGGTLPVAAALAAIVRNRRVQIRRPVADRFLRTLRLEQLSLHVPISEPRNVVRETQDFAAAPNNHVANRSL